MIKRPVRRGSNQVFPAIEDADGNEILVCTTEEVLSETIRILNSVDQNDSSKKEKDK